MRKKCVINFGQKWSVWQVWCRRTYKHFTTLCLLKVTYVKVSARFRTRTLNPMLRTSKPNFDLGSTGQLLFVPNTCTRYKYMLTCTTKVKVSYWHFGTWNSQVICHTHGEIHGPNCKPVAQGRSLERKLFPPKRGCTNILSLDSRLISRAKTYPERTAYMYSLNSFLRLETRKFGS